MFHLEKPVLYRLAGVDDHVSFINLGGEWAWSCRRFGGTGGFFGRVVADEDIADGDEEEDAED